MRKVKVEKLQKFACCTLDVTVGARLISFVGIMVSVLLITILLNDKYFQTKDNYDMSRKTALALGLDWQHFHWKASTSHHDDPDGMMISIIVIFYSFIFLLMNLLLCLGTIENDWRCALPWLISEVLGCLSKIGALIFHFYCADNLSNLFIIGSIVYIITIFWWWMVVFLAQISWRRIKKGSVQSLELSGVSVLSSNKSVSVPGRVRVFEDSVKDTENVDSPVAYTPNFMYAVI